MIPLRVLMNIEECPIVNPGETALQPEALAKLSAIGILIKGTEEGRPVVIVRAELPDGTFVLAETTFRLLHVAMRAFTARYGEFLDDR
jgi:hypothetical protein